MLASNITGRTQATDKLKRIEKFKQSNFRYRNYNQGRKIVLENQSYLNIARLLQESQYEFVAITPESHRRVLDRGGLGQDVRDIFGWNKPFISSALPEIVLAELQKIDAVKVVNDHYVSTIRFATLRNNIYLHSGFPTTDRDAVFFGPDTYRYARFLQQNVTSANRVVDVGCGSGAGGLSLSDRVENICLADINPLALKYASINAEVAGVSERTETTFSNILAQLKGEADLVISNPPYLVDDSKRAYRHGGELLGAGLSVEIVRQALSHLNKGGKLVLYTASAIVNGVDTFWQAIQPCLANRNLAVQYEEIDPDVFGEELERNAYHTVDRLAVVGLIVDIK